MNGPQRRRWIDPSPEKNPTAEAAGMVLGVGCPAGLMYILFIGLLVLIISLIVKAVFF